MSTMAAFEAQILRERMNLVARGQIIQIQFTLRAFLLAKYLLEFEKKS